MEKHVERQEKIARRRFPYVVGVTPGNADAFMTYGRMPGQTSPTG